MTPALFAPAATTPRPAVSGATVSGASVLPGVPLPEWVQPPDMPAPGAELPGHEATAVEGDLPEQVHDDTALSGTAVETAAEDPALVTAALPAHDPYEPAQPAPTVPAAYLSTLPDLGQAAWDEPAPEPHPGSLRYAAETEPSADRTGRNRMWVVLAVVGALAAAAFAAFALPGALGSSGEQVTAPPVHNAPAHPAPVSAAERYYTAWAGSTGVTKVSKVAGMPAGTSARCGSATVEGAAGTACAFVGPKAQGSLWFAGTGLKAASKQVAATAAAAGANGS